MLLSLGDQIWRPTALDYRLLCNDEESHSIPPALTEVTVALGPEVNTW